MNNITGVVNRILFHSDTFYILDLAVSDGKGMQIVKGNFFGLVAVRVGMPFELSGEWVQHAKFGRQLKVKGWDLFPKTIGGIKTFLSNGIPEFDLFTAEFVVDQYGLDTYKVLEDPERVLREVTEADPNHLKAALSGWAKTMAVRALSTLLSEGGLTIMDIETAIRRFGLDAPTIIKQNPFRLMEIAGFSFAKVDLLAKSMGFKPNDPCRLEGAALWALHEAGREGHLFFRRGDFPAMVLTMKKLLAPLPYTSAPDKGFAKAIAALEERRAVVSVDDVGVYTPEAYHYERTSVELLSAMITPSSMDLELEPFLEEFERSSQLSLAESQQDAVRQVIRHKVLVLTGLPGTGKTMTVRALVKLFEASRKSFSLMAPTGIAAKRLSHLTGYPASTIHRALGYDGVEWKQCAGNKHIVDAVIVDEMSMVDQELFYRLLSALRSDTMLVLVGDDAQLPSVGPGNVLRELVACPEVPHVRLTRIFRQSEGGDIVGNSHLINQGEFPVLAEGNSASEFMYFRLSDEIKIRSHIVRIATRLKEKDYNFQVLAPKYEGTVGVDNLNMALQEALNPPGPPEWKGRTQHFRVGDRVMVVKNNYQKGIYNGDVGKLLYVGGERLVVRIHGIGNDPDMEAVFTEVEADIHLRLAYAVSIHKSQGNEFDNIILPVLSSQGRMLQRNLLYTAVTRARKRVWLLGEESAIRQAISNNKVIRRNTVLAESLSGVLKARGTDGPSTHQDHI